MKNKKSKKIELLVRGGLSTAFLFVGLMGFQTQANAYSCYLDTHRPKAFIKSQTEMTEKSVLAGLQSMDKSVSSVLDLQTAVLTNAINTLTTQKAWTAQSVGESISNNSQLQTAAMQNIETAHKVKEVIVDYGPGSTGHQVCKVQAEREKIQKTSSNTKKAIPVMVSSEITARPGRYASKGNALATRLALHDQLYCTAAQASSGLCSREAPRSGKSLQASTLFVPSEYDSPEYRDKSAFINNMIGLPDNPLTQEKATTPQGQSYMDLKRRKDSIISTAATSLKAIQADYSVVSETHQHEETSSSATEDEPAVSEAKQLAESKDMPAAEAVNDKSVSKIHDDPLAIQVKKDVSRYLGSGKEYKEWSKTLVASPERGVLQEILRAKALRLYIQAQQYDQLSRMEAMLAANVAAETYRNGMESNIERQRQVIMRKNIAAALNN